MAAVAALGEDAAVARHDHRLELAELLSMVENPRQRRSAAPSHLGVALSRVRGQREQEENCASECQMPVHAIELGSLRGEIVASRIYMS